MAKRAKVVVSALNVRSLPAVVGSAVLRILRQNAEVEVEDQPVKANNIIWRRLVGASPAWIAEIDLTSGERFIQLIDSASPPPPDPQTWQVIGGIVNVRNAPNLTAQVVRRVSQGEKLTLDGNIRQVGEQGWVWRKLIRTGPDEWVAEANESSGQRLLERVGERDGNGDFGTSTSGRVQTRGTEFLLDGRPFRFVGANLREFAYYTRPDVLPAATANDQDMQITVLRQIGMRVVRLFAPHHLVDAETSISLVRAALDKLHQGSLLAIIALTDSLAQSGFCIPEDRPRFHNQVLGHVDKTGYFHQEGYKQFYLPFVQRMVTALRDHPAVFAWELGNEFAIHPQPANSPDGDAFFNFHQNVSRTIRQIAPNHLITTGLVNTGHGTPAFRNAEDYARRLYAIPTLDFATVHFYQREADPNAAMADEEGRSLVDLRVLRSLSKPLIVEEFGSTINNPNRVEFTSMKLNAWMSSGAAGFMQWGFSATGRDIGTGDNRHGMDNYAAGNAPVFSGLVNLYRDWAVQLRNG